MRVTTLQSAQQGLDRLGQRQGRMAELQQQLATGLRVARPGDDPVAAAQAEVARSRLARLAQDRRATDLATTSLQTADDALGQGVAVLQQAREALVAAGNGAYGSGERLALAGTLRAAREQLLALADRTDGAGQRIFGGLGTQAPVLAGTPDTWQAPAGVQRVGEQGRYANTVDGRGVFMSVPQGNGAFVADAAAANTGAGWIEPGSVADPALLTGHAYRIDIAGSPGSLTVRITDLDTATVVLPPQPLPADGQLVVHGQRVRLGGTPAPADVFTLGPAGRQSVFDTLDQAIAVLEQPSTPAGYAQRLQRAQADLDRALDGFTFQRSEVGQALRVVEEAAAANGDAALAEQARRSALQDLDYAAAISELQSHQTGLEAALKAYATISRMGLFQALG